MSVRLLLVNCYCWLFILPNMYAACAAYPVAVEIEHFTQCLRIRDRSTSRNHRSLNRIDASWYQIDDSQHVAKVPSVTGLPLWWVGAFGESNKSPRRYLLQHAANDGCDSIRAPLKTAPVDVRGSREAVWLPAFQGPGNSLPRPNSGCGEGARLDTRAELRAERGSGNQRIKPDPAMSLAARGGSGCG